MNLLSKRQYEAALKKAIQLDKMKPNIDCEVSLVIGVSFYRIGKDALSIRSFQRAMWQLSKSKRFNENETLYVQAFITMMLGEIYKIIKDDFEKERGKSLDFSVDYDRINLDLVRDRLKRNFQLVDHPDWE